VSGNLEFPVIPLPRPALMWAQARAFFVASYSLMTPVHHRQLATSRPTCCSHHEPVTLSKVQWAAIWRTCSRDCRPAGG